MRPMLSTKPLFSFIVPVFNAENYLNKCLNSICSQSFTDYEVVLVDDGSTDKSGEICNVYQKNNDRIKVFHKKNEGVSVARNKGLELAKGEYLVFVDSDDWIDDNFLEFVVTHIDDADLLFYGHKMHFSNGNVVSYYPHSITCENRSSIENEIVKLKHNAENFEYYGFTWNKVFRRNIIVDNEISFISDLSMREDELFTTTYCRHVERIKVISSPIYNYRITENGLRSKTNDAETYLRFIDYLRLLIPLWKTNELQTLEKLRCANFLMIASEKHHSLFGCFTCYMQARSFFMECEKTDNFPINRILRLPKLLGCLFISAKYLFSKVKVLFK